MPSCVISFHHSRFLDFMVLHTWYTLADLETISLQNNPLVTGRGWRRCHVPASSSWKRKLQDPRTVGFSGHPHAIILLLWNRLDVPLWLSRFLLLLSGWEPVVPHSLWLFLAFFPGLPVITNTCSLSWPAFDLHSPLSVKATTTTSTHTHTLHV